MQDTAKVVSADGIIGRLGDIKVRSIYAPEIVDIAVRKRRGAYKDPVLVTARNPFIYSPSSERSVGDDKRMSFSYMPDSSSLRRTAGSDLISVFKIYSSFKQNLELILS
jgi:hypothetical protein